FQMIDDGLTMIRVAVERVGIIAKAGNRHAVLPDQVPQLLGRVVGEIRHIQVAHACVSPARLARRPAHQLDAAEPFLGGKRQHFIQRQITENGRDESQLHWYPSMKSERQAAHGTSARTAARRCWISIDFARISEKSPSSSISSRAPPSAEAKRNNG